MGRETKLLLGLLATLLGVFVGVLSMKLLVPRPPAGAGPDIQADIAATEPHDLVEPPRFTADAAAVPAKAPAVNDRPDRSRFGGSSSRDPASPAADPFVARASFDEPVAATPAPPRYQATDSLTTPPTSNAPQSAFEPAPQPGFAYVARPGDSWWSLAEKVYGDGRLYRAVFAWNRALDPRVSLVAGTSIELPPRDRLEAAWPALMPTP